jgi:predicted glycoside hydrolase/deacetylase ChbG (UPF0249 family)
MRAFLVTADDWGLSPGVNGGILRLARAGALQRVSLMANEPYLTEGLDELRAVAGLELGIHFNLTHGKLLSGEPAFASPGSFLARWLRALAARDAPFFESIGAELRLQHARLGQLGVVPTHFDSHQHVHLVPGFLARNSSWILASGMREIRLPADPALWFGSKAPIALLSLLARRSARRELPQPRPFRYPPAPAFESVESWSRYLAEVPEGSEVLVHPAESADTHLLADPDTYSAPRVLEHRTLLSWISDDSASSRPRDRNSSSPRTR